MPVYCCNALITIEITAPKANPVAHCRKLYGIIIKSICSISFLNKQILGSRMPKRPFSNWVASFSSYKHISSPLIFGTTIFFYQKLNYQFISGNFADVWQINEKLFEALRGKIDQTIKAALSLTALSSENWNYAIQESLFYWFLWHGIILSYIGVLEKIRTNIYNKSHKKINKFNQHTMNTTQPSVKFLAQIANNFAYLGRYRRRGIWENQFAIELRSTNQNCGWTTFRGRLNAIDAIQGGTGGSQYSRYKDLQVFRQQPFDPFFFFGQDPFGFRMPQQQQQNQQPPETKRQKWPAEQDLLFRWTGLRSPTNTSWRIRRRYNALTKMAKIWCGNDQPRHGEHLAVIQLHENRG